MPPRHLAMTVETMPLEQHPVPQEISSYEFRLVGDMTLKQFLQLAGGVGIAFLIFVTPIPGFIKWPIVVFSALGGAALAFLPIEERPLSFWIFSFLKAIYSPTLYSWQESAEEDVFSKESTLLPKVTGPEGEQKAQEYLNSLPQTLEVAPFEKNEEGFFSRVMDMFGQVTHVAPRPSDAAQPFAEAATPILQPEVRVPTQQPIKVEHQPKSFPALPVAQNAQALSPVFGEGQTTANTQSAIFSLEAAPPNPPTVPNTMVGLVVTNQGKIVEGAILEIREVGGNPVRALRTNKVGHFLTVTPLKDGEYEIETDKDGLTFDVVRVQVKSEIIPPILIKAR